MIVKNIVIEDYVQYKKPCMYIGCYRCDWKCCTEANIPNTVCQNQPIAKMKNIEVSYEELYNIYINNKITKSIVFAGLEPMLQFEDIIGMIEYFRKNGCEDDFVIYTGYYPEEVDQQIENLKKYSNIYIKFGRYIPGHKKHFDEVLGIELASDNQYGVKIS